MPFFRTSVSAPTMTAMAPLMDLAALALITLTCQISLAVALESMTSLTPSLEGATPKVATAHEHTAEIWPSICGYLLQMQLPDARRQYHTSALPPATTVAGQGLPQAVRRQHARVVTARAALWRCSGLSLARCRHNLPAQLAMERARWSTNLVRPAQDRGGHLLTRQPRLRFLLASTLGSR